MLAEFVAINQTLKGDLVSQHKSLLVKNYERCHMKNDVYNYTAKLEHTSASKRIPICSGMA